MDYKNKIKEWNEKKKRVVYLSNLIKLWYDKVRQLFMICLKCF